VTARALAALVTIVVSGAAVRLTGSGLGCTDWPTCTEESFVPEATLHGVIEFVNRLFTGVVSVAVIAAVLASMRRNPRRRDLTRWSWGLVAGVVVQVVLGGITVLTSLRPEVVMAHFLLSIVLIWNAVVLHHRAGLPDLGPVEVAPSPPAATRRLRILAWATGATTAITVLAGTVVTAAGPHAGDEDVARLALDLPDAAVVHAGTVWLVVALVVALLVTVNSHEANRRFTRHVRVFGFLVVGQGALGYIQYFSDIPALLVGIHIVGACAVWISAVQLVLVTKSDNHVPIVDLPNSDESQHMVTS